MALEILKKIFEQVEGQPPVGKETLNFKWLAECAGKEPEEVLRLAREAGIKVDDKGYGTFPETMKEPMNKQKVRLGFHGLRLKGGKVSRNIPPETLEDWNG